LALTGRLRAWPISELFPPYPVGFPHLALLNGGPRSAADSEDGGQFTFRRFADLFVRSAVWHTLVKGLPLEEGNRDRWENLYRTLSRGLEDTGRESVPFDNADGEDLLDRLMQPYAGGLEEGEAAFLREGLRLRLERVEAKEGVPARIYPFSRDPAEGSPRTVVLDPRIRFGRPTVAGSGTPTDVLFERYQAGDSVADLVEDYGLTTAEVEEAIRYEAMPPAALFPFYAW
jgi:uncharacterized protein (DUF433 family)